MRTSRRAALAWALDQRQWIEAQLARALPAEPFEAGAVIPVEGVETLIVWSEREPRTPRLANGELRCGGPPKRGSPAAIEAFLKRQAHRRRCRARSPSSRARPERRATSVSVGDAGTRWGSCSSQGRIRLSWRLILAPPQARRYVVAHEVAHLKHLNHGADFKALEARLFGPGMAEAKATLRDVGPRLRRLGRGR